LIDVLVEDGARSRAGDTNPGEIKFIIDEIKQIIKNPYLQNRSIGVVSLLGHKQAHKIWDEITLQIEPDLIEKYNIACGDARTFQGKERDIVFLSMVVSPGEAQANNRIDAEHRFNVAASRARDRMYLVRSVEASDLSDRDKLRRGLIQHFKTPFANDEQKVIDLRTLCESDFEREIYDLLIERGYKVMPQVGSKGYVIDLVVEDEQGTRIAIECDGDRYHGPDKWQDDMRRQRILERVGWTFWRCFASTFILNKGEVVEDLLKTISDLGIKPTSLSSTNYQSSFVESRNYTAFNMQSEKIEEEFEETVKCLDYWFNYFSGS
jgi:very-short-patch-repair endonuclease